MRYQAGAWERAFCGGVRLKQNVVVFSEKCLLFFDLTPATQFHSRRKMVKLLAARSVWYPLKTISRKVTLGV